jgi:CubicO group peptidase (beta-lactamase class C family)
MRQVQRSLVGLLVIFVLLEGTMATTTAAPQPLPEPTNVAAWADSVMSDSLQRLDIPGAVLLVVKDGNVYFSRGYGYADLAKQTPMDPANTTIRVASITKTFTALAVMQLVEQGKLDLEADVNSYLKEWQLPATYAEPIRVRDLLVHTGGFDEQRIGNDGAAATASTLATWLRNPPLRVRPPGEIISYSNYGYALAGHLIEIASGESYADYVQRHILEPLGMRDSSAAQPIPRGLAERLSRGYLRTTNGRTPVEPLPISDAPAGSLVSTAADMGRYLIAQLDNGNYAGGQLLRPATMQQMHAQQAINHPALPGWTYGAYERFENGRRLLVHGGDLPGYVSLAMFIPSEQVGFFLFYNQPVDPLSGNEDPREQFLRHFMDRFYPAAEQAAPNTRLRADPALAGTYRYSRFVKGTVERIITAPQGALIQLTVTTNPDGTLTVRYPFDVRPATTWTPIEPLIFQRTSAPYDLLAFRSDTTNQPSHIFLTYSVPLTFERIAWYETLPSQGILFATALVLLLIALIGLPVVALRSRGSGWRLAAATALLGILILATLIWSTLNFDDTQPLSPWVRAAMIGSIAFVGLTLGNLLLLIRAWAQAQPSLSQRILLTINGFGSGLLVWLLHYWRVLTLPG